MRKISFVLALLLLCTALSSCGNDTGRTLVLSQKVAEKFPLPYGALYSDIAESGVNMIDDELKRALFGANAEKLTYIKEVSGYFSRDMISGGEFIAVRLIDRSHRAEMCAVFFERARLKTDMETRVFADGDLVFFASGRYAAEIKKLIVGE